MVKVLDVVQPREGKEGKTYWQKLGVKFVSDDGRERGEVWLNVFEQRPREDAGASGTWSKPEDTASEDFEDEIPF